MSMDRQVKAPAIFLSSATYTQTQHHEVTTERKNLIILNPSIDQCIENLGFIVSPVAKHIIEKTGCSKKMVMGTFLPAMGFLVQGKRTLKTHSGSIPLSTYFLTVAESGEGKSLISNFIFEPILEHEKRQLIIYECELKDYEKKLKRYQAKKNQTDEPEPEKPISPRYILDDVTLDQLLVIGKSQPSILLLEDEGGSMIGGYSMNRDNKIRTLSTMNKIWSNRAISIERLERSLKIYDMRLTQLMCLQPDIAKSLFIDDRQANDSGLLARFLTIYANDRIDDPKCLTETVTDCHSYGIYKKIVTDHLQCRYAQTDESPIVFDPLHLSADAEKLYIAFFERVNSTAVKQAFNKIRAFLSKAAEHALRMAAILTLFDDAQATHVEADYMRKGIELICFYIHELDYINTTDTPQEKEREDLIDQSHQAIIKAADNDKGYVSLGVCKRYMPYALRKDSKKFLEIIALLEKMNLIDVKKPGNTVYITPLIA